MRDAADCRALLTALGIDRAHVVGLSYSCAIGLQLAADTPACGHSLVLLEPPPTHTSSAPAFLAATDRLIRDRHERGAADALDEFLTSVLGPSFLAALERRLPGGWAQSERDALTFFDTDLPALRDWRFSKRDARRIECPVLYVGGDVSGDLFAGVRELVLDWLPQAEDVVIQGAGHSLALTHPTAAAAAVAAFLSRHPLSGGSTS